MSVLSKEIKTSQWKPNHDPLDYKKDFVKWIDSINSDWRDMITYEPFELYKKQAKHWLKDKTSPTELSEDDQIEWLVREYHRCKDNTLYYANKYGRLKEGDIEGGGMPYEAWKAQEVVLFLADCGYNLMIGKPRQVGFTSTMGILANCRINFNPSYFVKFITHSSEKGEEIFRDKVQWPFGFIPDYLRQPVYNFSHNHMSLRADKEKGKMGGFNSRFLVASPSVDAINGGSPNLVLLDEIGLMTILGSMMREGRPALFWFDPRDKKMKMKRQLIAWGTGGMTDGAGAVYEAEFKAAMDAWRERNFNYGIIPIFFNAYAREGLTEKMFDQEKQAYYSVQGVDAEKSRVQFHMHYPMTLDDMFLKSAKTLLPIPVINGHLAKIYRLSGKEKPQYGYFEPEYDTSRPTPEMDTPYRIVGAIWVPTTGVDDERTTTCIFRHPEAGWEYRYYQGTDPISSQTGHSKMSSSIWDAYENTVAACMFHRSKDFKESFLQATLLGLYYQPGLNGTPELLENNIGDFYYDYVETKGFGRRFIPTSALPKTMHTGSAKWWGISNKANSAPKIINKLIELLDVHADSIYIPWFWLQLKTFVEKALNNPTDSSRQSRYQAADLRYNWDDAIFSIVFSYINAECHSRYEPMQRVSTGEKKKVFRRLVQNAQTNFSLRLAEVDEDGKIIRYIGR